MEDQYCCKLREKFVIGIVGVNEDLPDPVDIVELIDFEKKSPNGFPIIYLPFCTFCGRKIDRNEHRRIVEPISRDEDDSDSWRNSVAD